MIVVIIDENVFGDLEDVIADIAPAVFWPVRAKILLKLTHILTGRHEIVAPAPVILEIESCCCSAVKLAAKPERTLLGFVLLSKKFEVMVKPNKHFPHFSCFHVGHFTGTQSLIE